jgi:hypothetical protein
MTPSTLFRRASAGCMTALAASLGYILREIVLMRSSPAFAVAMWQTVPRQFESVLCALAAYLGFAVLFDKLTG